MKKLTIYCDGGSRGNPGKAGIGIVILDESGEVLKKHKEKIGIATNNVAEYKSLIKALEIALELKAEELNVNMDSELIIRQMNGQYQVKNKDLLKLHQKVKELSKELKKISYNHIKRENNSFADRLVNEALDGM